MDTDAIMELDEAMGLDEAIAVAFSSQEFAYLMLYLLAATVLYVYFYFSGKAKDKNYSKEMADREYTLRYSRKDMAGYIMTATLGISLSIMLFATPYILEIGLSFSIAYLAIYLFILTPCVLGITCAMIYIQRLKWKVVISGELITVHKLFSKPREYRFSDIANVGKRFYRSASRGYGGTTVLCYSIYVRSSDSSKEKVFEVHKLFTGFDRFEAHLISTGIQIQRERAKSKSTKLLVILCYHSQPPGRRHITEVTR